MAWRHFKYEEFKCRHCGLNKQAHDFIDKLDELRHRCGFALPVTSGYRCPDHNSRVSNTGRNGPHTTGRAVDLSVSRGPAMVVLYEAMGMGFTGFGIQQRGGSRFIHLDDLRSPAHPRPTIWSY